MLIYRETSSVKNLHLREMLHPPLPSRNVTQKQKHPGEDTDSRNAEQPQNGALVLRLI